MAQAPPSAGTFAARYDLLRREVGTIAPDPDGTGPLAFAATRNTYDSAGRLTKVEKGQLAAWQSESVAPASWSGFTVFSQVDTAYDAMGRKVREAVSGDGATAGVTEYGYDLAGRLQCTAVSASGAKNGALAYDPLGRLWQVSSAATGTTRFLYDGDQLIQEFNGSGTLLRDYDH